MSYPVAVRLLGSAAASGFILGALQADRLIEAAEPAEKAPEGWDLQVNLMVRSDGLVNAVTYAALSLRTALLRVGVSPVQVSIAGRDT